jgi:VWFA-related protein
LKFGSSALRFFLTSFAALLLLAPAAAVSSARQAGAGVKADSTQIVVPLGAVDKDGAPVEGLKPEDLRVTVEGAGQEILSLAPRAGETLHVVLMLDTSVSQVEMLKFARPAAAEFVSALLRPGDGGKADAAVVTFTGDAKVVEGLTVDLAALNRAIESAAFVPPPGYIPGGFIVAGTPPKNSPAVRAGSTAIWDSLVAVCDDVLARAGEGRRVVVIFTDGDDTSSRTNKDKAVGRLLRGRASVYAVGIGDSYHFAGVSKGELRKVSERTGGRSFFPKTDKDLSHDLERLRRELHSSYALMLAPPPPRAAGEQYRLRIEVVNPGLRKRGVELAYPRGFYAGNAPAAVKK